MLLLLVSFRSNCRMLIIYYYCIVTYNTKVDQLSFASHLILCFIVKLYVKVKTKVKKFSFEC